MSNKVIVNGVDVIAELEYKEKLIEDLKEMYNQKVIENKELKEALKSQNDLMNEFINKIKCMEEKLSKYTFVERIKVYPNKIKELENE